MSYLDYDFIRRHIDLNKLREIKKFIDENRHYLLIPAKYQKTFIIVNNSKNLIRSNINESIRTIFKSVKSILEPILRYHYYGKADYTTMIFFLIEYFIENELKKSERKIGNLL